MFVAIVIIAVLIGLLFIAVAVSFVSFIYSNIKKNDILKKRSFKFLVPSAILWVLFIGINIVLIVMFLHKNREEILDKSVRIPAEMMGKGLALTFQSFEKNWDKNRIQQLQNLYISSSTIDYTIENGMRVYDIELIFDNNSPAEVKLYLDDLIGNHYLVVCDKDDFVYLLEISDRLMSSVKTERTTEQTTDGVTERTTKTSTQYANTIIPFGKSKFGFTVTVPEDVEITHARFVEKVIQLK
ncbi:MAG: hypothetical protein LBK83_03495 [Treponema sp.]|jgi:hypothetical protein|nr:hypothetical protein [Treponema sp.]